MAHRTASAGTSAQRYVPSDAATLDQLRAAAARCRGCPLYADATQTVFGQGPPDARMVLIGEQPGDVEDRRGEPFVGPAGKLLDRAIAEVGLDRDQLYLTNAVKHFKFVHTEPRGRRRIHQAPNRYEVSACRPWLHTELSLLHPMVVVALGATAAQALLGPDFRVTRSRGILLPWPDTAPALEAAPRLLATAHPSSVLRSRNRARDFAELVHDLRNAAVAL